MSKPSIFFAIRLHSILFLEYEILAKFVKGMKTQNMSAASMTSDLKTCAISNNSNEAFHQPLSVSKQRAILDDINTDRYVRRQLSNSVF